MARRDFLKLGAAWTLSGAIVPAHEAHGLGRRQKPLRPVPRINGGINVQPVRRLDGQLGFTDPLIIPELVDLQMRLVYELGYEWIRITISFDDYGPDFFAAIPYVRAARALGIHVLGIIGQFTGLDLLRELARSQTREEVLRVYLSIFDDFVPPATPAIERPGIFAAQVLNEPTSFHSISPRTYVREFLAPVYETLKNEDPQLTVVSAAEAGNAAGFLRTRAMFEAGVDNFCDRVAYHIYDRRWIPRLAGMTHKTIWVTESGVAPPERHLAWITQTFEEIRRGIEGVEQVFYFQLFDTHPQTFRLIDIVAQPDGGFQEVVESPAAVEHLASRVAEASGGQPRATYRDLIPDITRYFPTEEDLALIATTSFRQEARRFSPS